MKIGRVQIPEYIGRNFNKYKYVLLVCLVGLLLAAWPSGRSPDAGQPEAEPSGAFPQAQEDYHADFGTCRCYDLGERRFLDLFSANDPQSSLQLLRETFPEGGELTLIYNHRADRPDRLLLFLRHFFPQVPCRKVIVLGECRYLARRLLHRAGVEQVELAANWREALEQADTPQIAGVGNIKGQAYQMIEYLERGEAHE